jgi:hypothetical protein
MNQNSFNERDLSFLPLVDPPLRTLCTRGIKGVRAVAVSDPLIQGVNKKYINHYPL